MIDALPSVKADGKVCDGCRKQLTLLIVKPSSLDNKEPLNESCDNPCNDADDDYTCPLDLESINDSLKGIGKTPVIKKKLVHKSYTKDNCDRPQENLPSLHLGLIVEIPVLKVVISITTFCSC